MAGGFAGVACKASAISMTRASDSLNGQAVEQSELLATSRKPSECVREPFVMAILFSRCERASFTTRQCSALASGYVLTSERASGFVRRLPGGRPRGVSLVRATNTQLPATRNNEPPPARADGRHKRPVARRRPQRGAHKQRKCAF